MVQACLILTINIQAPKCIGMCTCVGSQTPLKHPDWGPHIFNFLEVIPSSPTPPPPLDTLCMPMPSCIHATSFCQCWQRRALPGQTTVSFALLAFTWVALMTSFGACNWAWVPVHVSLRFTFLSFSRSPINIHTLRWCWVKKKKNSFSK